MTQTHIYDYFNDEYESLKTLKESECVDKMQLLLKINEKMQNCSKEEFFDYMSYWWDIRSKHSFLLRDCFFSHLYRNLHNISKFQLQKLVHFQSKSTQNNNNNNKNQNSTNGMSNKHHSFFLFN